MQHRIALFGILLIGVALSFTRLSWAEAAPAPDSPTIDVRGFLQRLAVIASSASQTTAPKQTSPRFMTLEGAKGANPAALYGWVIPKGGSEQRAAEFLAEIWTRESLAILKQELVTNTKLALDVSSWFADEGGVFVFGLEVTTQNSANLEPIEQRVESMLERIRTSGLHASELERLVDHGVSVLDVQQLLRAYLCSSRRITVEVYPDRAPQFGLGIDKPQEAHPAAATQAVRDLPSLDARSDKLDRGRPVRENPTSNAANEKRAVSRKKPATERVHIVKKGESLLAIARRYRVSVAAITSRNDLNAKRIIRPGQRVTIPGS